MRALVVGALPAPDPDGTYARLLAAAESIVAADGGAALCRERGARPDLVVGDLDSLDERKAVEIQAAGIPIERHPVAKDCTDLELAIAAARRLGATHLTLTAAFGGRLDHTLAALGCLLDAADLAAEAREPGWSAWALDSHARPELALRAAESTLVSLLAPAGASGVDAEGFRFPLAGARLGPLSGLGVSNVTASPEVRVRVGEGRLLVIASHPANEGPQEG